MLATKADPRPGGRFDGARVRESVEESTQRLRVNSFPLYHLHDPERFDFDELRAPGCAVKEMTRLRQDGRVGAIGVAGGDIDQLRRFIDLDIFDAILNHNQLTLLDRRADELVDYAVGHGVAFINAAPFAGGILARDLSFKPRFQYRPPSVDVLEKVSWLQKECDEYEVPIPAVALQFSPPGPEGGLDDCRCVGAGTRGRTHS